MAKPWEKYQAEGPWSRYQQPAAAPARSRATPEQARTAARAAFEASRASPEQVEARRRDAMHPVRRYLTEWGEAISEAGREGDAPFRTPAALAAVPELAASAATGVTSLVTEPIAELVTGRDQPRGSHVYQPQTGAGRALAERLGAVIKPVGDYFTEAVPTAFERGAEALGASPETAREVGEGGGRVFEAATLGAPVKAARAAGKPAVAPGAEAVQAGRTAAAAAPRELPKPARTPVEVARALGLKVEPAASNTLAGKVGHVLEEMSGPTHLRARLARENQPQSNRVVLEDLGLSPDQRLTAQTLDQAAKPHVAVSDELANTVPILTRDEALNAAIERLGVRTRDNPLLEKNPSIERLRARMSKTGDVPTRDVLDAIRDWREQATGAFAQARTSKNRSKLRAQANAYLDLANAFETALGRAATAAGDPKLAARFKEARTALAKINDVRASLVGDEVDVHTLASLSKKRPLSGRLRALAETGRDLRAETKRASTVRTPTREVITGYQRAARIGQGLIRGFGTQRLLTSDFYQNLLGKVDPAPGPGSPLGAFFPAAGGPGPRAAPAPVGGLSFDLSPEVPPAAALRNPEAPPGLELVPAPGGMSFRGSPELSRADELAGGLRVADETGHFPGARVPEEAALTEFFTDQPIGPNRPGIPQPVPATAPAFLTREGMTSPTRPFYDPEVPMAPGRPGEPSVLELAPEGFDPDSLVARLFAENPGLRESVYAGLDATLNDMRTGSATPGRAETRTLFRAGSDDPSETLGGAFSYSPQRTTAARYGQPVQRDVGFSSMLGDESMTFREVQQALGFEGQVDLPAMIERARELGYDGITYNLADGVDGPPTVETIHIPPRK